MKRFVLLLLLFLSFPTSALATSRLEGPVPAQLVRVIDGDTVLVEVRPWFGHRFEVSVRLYGIDAPEIHSSCYQERLKAAAAKQRLQSLLANAPLQLSDIRKGKYFGRVIARIELKNVQDISQILLQEKLVRPYRGGARRAVFCAK